MPIDTNSPEGLALWNLSRRLHERRTGRYGTRRWNRESMRAQDIRPGLDLLDAYYRGDPPLARVHEGWKPYVRQAIRMGRLNVAELLVTSPRNRMKLRDFRTAAADDEFGDAEARNIMRANKLAVVSRDVHDWMLAFGDSYTLTQPPAAGDTYSRITAEDPRQFITDDDPLTGRVRYGLKVYRDDWDAADWAWLYLPDGRIMPAKCEGRTRLGDGTFRFDAQGWEWYEQGFQTTPDNLPPISHFRNEHGVGEFEQHLDALDRINDKIFHEWWIAKIQAFRQRAVKGLPDTDRDGNEIDYTDMFTAAPDEMWQVPEDVDFWESATVDLTPITASVQKDLERLAAVKSQPLHTITPDAANGSAEGASLMREESLYKIEDRIDRASPEWAETMARAFRYQGDSSRADVTQIETLWGPIERYSLGQRADAANKVRGVVPTEAVWTDILQYPPAEVGNLRTLRGRDMLYQAAQGGVASTAPVQTRAPQQPQGPDNTVL